MKDILEGHIGGQSPGQSVGQSVEVSVKISDGHFDGHNDGHPQIVECPGDCRTVRRTVPRSKHPITFSVSAIAVTVPSHLRWL